MCPSANRWASYRQHIGGGPVDDRSPRLSSSRRRAPGFGTRVRRGGLWRRGLELHSVVHAVLGPPNPAGHAHRYEAIEPVAESFGDLDPRIDARVNDLAPGTPWTGFHHIEQIHWQKNTTAGTAALAQKLNDDVRTLQRKVAALSYQPAQLANGSVELLNEVATSKITGEEDRYSHTDLSDFQGNLEGSRLAFDLLRPALDAEGDRALGNTIAQRFGIVQSGLDRYRRRTPWPRLLAAPSRISSHPPGGERRSSRRARPRLWPPLSTGSNRSP